MQNFYGILFVVSLNIPTLAIAVQTIPEIEEAVEAARSGKEPKYLGRLMAGFSIEVSRFARERQIYSPKQKRELLHLMALVVHLAHEVANAKATNVFTEKRNTEDQAIWKIASDAAHDTGWGEAALAVQKFYSMRWLVHGKCFGEDLWLAAWRTAREYTNSLPEDEDPATVARIGYRIAECVVANRLFGQNASTLIAASYADPTYLFRVDYPDPKRPYELVNANPFENIETFNVFSMQFFGHLRQQSRIFLAPWLDVLGALMNRPALAQFQIGWWLDTNSIVSILPRDVVLIISAMVMHPLGLAKTSTAKRF